MAEKETGQPDRELRDLQEERSRLVSLQSHPGYTELLKIAHEQMESRKQAVFLVPLKALDETLEQEYLKGEISGIFLFTNMTQVRVDELNREINAKLPKGEQEKEYGGFDEPGASAP